jgi:hypothetical protein
MNRPSCRIRTRAKRRPPGMDARILPVRRVGLSGTVARVMSGSVHSSASGRKSICCVGIRWQEDECCHAEPQLGGAGQAHGRDQVRQDGTQLDRPHRCHSQLQGCTAAAPEARAVMADPGWSSSHRSRPGAARCWVTAPASSSPVPLPDAWHRSPTRSLVIAMITIASVNPECPSRPTRATGSTVRSISATTSLRPSGSLNAANYWD